LLEGRVVVKINERGRAEHLCAAWQHFHSDAACEDGSARKRFRAGAGAESVLPPNK
jgi:hypothetical protein